MPAYYNEFDPYAAEWLRNLIDAGHIPAGDVDERSITEVQPDDLDGYTQCHFFAGVAGWPLALRLAGWPDDAPVWTGSCPCQPFSAAGKGKGTADERHLWPEFHRLIAECRPSITFGEQVASKAGRAWLAGVRAEMEALGYGFGAADLCAAGIGAPHIRQRLFWVADATGGRHERRVDRDTVCEKRANEGGREAEGLRLASTASSGLARRMADTASLRGPEHVNHSGERQTGETNHSADSRSTRRMGHAIDPRPQGFAGNGNGSCEPGRERAEANRPAATAGDAPCGLGNATGDHEQRPPVTPMHREGQQTGGSSELGGVAEPNGPELREQSPAGKQPVHEQGDWPDFRILHCKDSRARRISAQSSDEPLAYGLPRDVGRVLAGVERVDTAAIRHARRNRTGRLKGYGNAIVPQLAAEFIAAWMECAD